MSFSFPSWRQLWSPRPAVRASLALASALAWESALRLFSEEEYLAHLLRNREWAWSAYAAALENAVPSESSVRTELDLRPRAAQLHGALEQRPAGASRALMRETWAYWSDPSRKPPLPPPAVVPPKPPLHCPSTRSHSLWSAVVVAAADIRAMDTPSAQPTPLDEQRGARAIPYALQPYWHGTDAWRLHEALGERAHGLHEFQVAVILASARREWIAVKEKIARFERARPPTWWVDSSQPMLLAVLLLVGAVL